MKLNAIHKELIYVDLADEIRLQIKGVLRKEDRRVSLFCNVATGGRAPDTWIRATGRKPP